MTWFEVGLKLGLGLIAAVALVGLVIIVVATVCISCTEREQRRLHRLSEEEFAGGEVDDELARKGSVKCVGGSRDSWHF